MGKLVASIKVFPEDIVISKEKLEEGIKKVIPEDASIYRIDEEPIAFGLVALIVHVIIPETDGAKLNEIEEAFRKVKGISEIETLLVRKI